MTTKCEKPTEKQIDLAVDIAELLYPDYNLEDLTEDTKESFSEFISSNLDEYLFQKGS